MLGHAVLHRHIPPLCFDVVGEAEHVLPQVAGGEVLRAVQERLGGPRHHGEPLLHPAHVNEAGFDMHRQLLEVRRERVERDGFSPRLPNLGYVFIAKTTLSIFSSCFNNVLTKNYTVRQILKMIKDNNYKIKIKKTISPILNQNSYLVSDQKMKKMKIFFNKDIKKDIKATLGLLKSLY